MNGFAFLWLAAGVLFAVVEASTVALVSLWFLGGSLAAMVAAMLGAKLWLQGIIFLVVSGLLLACLRPFVKKFMQPKLTPTNFDRIIGTEAPVTEDIDNLLGTGAVKVGGTEWSARSEHGEAIAKGTVVKILRVEGVKAIVSPV